MCSFLNIKFSNFHGHMFKTLNPRFMPVGPLNHVQHISLIYVKLAEMLGYKKQKKQGNAVL